MRLLLVVAAVAIAYVAAPPDADAAAKRAGKPRVAPKAQCATAAAERPARARLRAVAKRRAVARRRALARRCAKVRGPLVGESRAGVIGVPGSFAAPAPFAAAPAPVTPGGPPTASPAPVATPEPVVLPPIYSNPYAVQVQGFEFGLQLSKATVFAGDVRVEFNLSRAEDPHNLWLVREDGTGTPHSFDESPSGAVVAQTLALTRGRWKLFCSLAGHEVAGMRATLTFVPRYSTAARSSRSEARSADAHSASCPTATRRAPPEAASAISSSSAAPRSGAVLLGAITAATSAVVTPSGKAASASATSSAGARRRSVGSRLATITS